MEEALVFNPDRGITSLFQTWIDDIDKQIQSISQEQAQKREGYELQIHVAKTYGRAKGYGSKLRPAKGGMVDLTDSPIHPDASTYRDVIIDHMYARQFMELVLPDIERMLGDLKNTIRFSSAAIRLWERALDDYDKIYQSNHGRPVNTTAELFRSTSIKKVNEMIAARMEKLHDVSSKIGYIQRELKIIGDAPAIETGKQLKYAINDYPKE